MALFEAGHENVPWYGTQYRTNLTTQMRNAPKLWQAESTFAPLYAALQNKIFTDRLLGSEGGDFTYDVPGYTLPIKKKKKDDGGFFDGDFGNAISGFVNDAGTFGAYSAGGGGKTLLNESFGNGGGGGTPGFRTVGAKTLTLHRPKTRGFLDLYQNEISPAMRAVEAENNRYQRQQDVNDLALFGPQAREALRATNPQAASILDELAGSATSDLALGADLNASQMRNVQQSTRAAQAARGMGFGPTDAFTESLNALDYGRGLENERRRYAQSVMAQLADFYAPANNVVMGRDTSTGAMSGGLLNAGQIGGLKVGGLFQPESPLAASIYQFNANAANQDKMLGQQQWAHMMDQIKDSTQQSAGLFAGGM